MASLWMSNPVTSLLTTWRGSVLPEWVDYNGHLRDAFYMLLFSYATDGLMDTIGLGESGRAETGHSLFTLEAHINYLKEVREGATVEVCTQVLGYDNKRLRIYHSLYRSDAQLFLAGNEQMLVNIDMAGPFSTPFAPMVLESIRTLASQHLSLPSPEYAGRHIALPGDRHG
jgi:acyl-CoA thioester hydrolase